jgi:hypothetical protein
MESTQLREEAVLEVPALMEQVGNMTIRLGDGKSRREVKKLGLGVARSSGADERSGSLIADQMRFQTLHNFRSMCRVLNLDPLNNAALQLCVLLMSRQFRALDDDAESKAVLDELGEDGRNVDWSGVQRLREKTLMNTMHDWSLMLHYLELAPCEGPAQESELQEQAIKAIKASMKHAGLEFACNAPTLMQRALLHMSVHGLQQEKMLEQLFVQYARSQEQVPAHDLEVRCLRMVTHYSNNAQGPEVEQQRLLRTLVTLVPSKAYVEGMSGLLAKVEAEQQVQAEEQHSRRQSSRVQLRYLVLSEAVSSASVAYDRSFASWANVQRFPISTSQRLQQVLYFIRAQTDAVPLEVYKLYFSEAIAQRVQQSTIDSIDPDAMHAVLTFIRSYRHNIADLIDFRATCLSGVSVTIRSALTLQQVLQLYIAAFQHPSVRETPWRRVLNVWNHSVQQSVAL